MQRVAYHQVVWRFHSDSCRTTPFFPDKCRHIAPGRATPVALSRLRRYALLVQRTRVRGALLLSVIYAVGVWRCARTRVSGDDFRRRRAGSFEVGSLRSLKPTRGVGTDWAEATPLITRGERHRETAESLGGNWGPVAARGGRVGVAPRAEGESESWRESP